MSLLNQQTRINGGHAEVWDTLTYETHDIMCALRFADDFLGQSAVAVPAAGAAVDGDPWVAKIVAAAGAPTVAGVANAAGGQVAATLAVTSEKEDAVLYWGDNLGIDITKHAIFETRVNLSVLPSATGVQAVWGLASVWIDGPNNNTCYARFGATANGAILIQTFDGVTTKSVATGVTVIAGAWHYYRIDATDITNVRFFIDGAEVSTTGLVNFAATGTLAVLQPYLGVYKPSGAGVGTLIADYVKIWSNRQ
jgi:hypothetical protein